MSLWDLLKEIHGKLLSDAAIISSLISFYIFRVITSYLLFPSHMYIHEPAVYFTYKAKETCIPLGISSPVLASVPSDCSPLFTVFMRLSNPVPALQPTRSCSILPLLHRPPIKCNLVRVLPNLLVILSVILFTARFLQ